MANKLVLTRDEFFTIIHALDVAEDELLGFAKKAALLTDCQRESIRQSAKECSELREKIAGADTIEYKYKR